MKYVIRTRKGFVSGFNKAEQVVQVSTHNDHIKLFPFIAAAEAFKSKYADCGYGFSSDDARILPAESVYASEEVGWAELLPRIGVTPTPNYGDETMVELGVDTGYDGYDGYIKFQTCAPAPTLDFDRHQANQFQAWLEAKHLKYVRGYPDDVDEFDRRFLLPPETTKAVMEAMLP